MAKFKVWTSQVNQLCWTVEAANEQQARRKVRKEWKQDNEPRIVDIVNLDEPDEDDDS